MTAAIFCVVSPLQYINALEAIEVFSLDPKNCYLAVGESKKLPATSHQIRSLIEPERWAAIQDVTGVPAPRGKNAVHTELLFLRGARRYVRAANSLIDQARRDCGKIQYVFLGDFRPLNFRHFFGAVPEAEHWLLDDGSVTHQVVRYRKDPDSPHLFAKPFARGSARNLTRSKVSGLLFANPESVGLFTCYDVVPALRDRIKQHDYPYFRKVYSSMEAIDEVWFLGSNHIENKFTTRERYFALLDRARNFYAGKTVVYIPHRGESEVKLRDVETMGFEIRNFDLPIEIAIGQKRRFPRILAGIASSALDNLSVILKDRIQIDLFCVAEGYASKERWKHLGDVIRYHQRDVFGLTTFVYEGGYGSRSGRVRDYRFARATGGLDDLAWRGYFRGPDGLLHGSLPAVALQRSEDRLRISFPTPPCSGDFRLGERIRLREGDGGEVVRATVNSVSNNGELDVEVERTGARDFSSGRCFVELLEPRLEFYGDWAGVAGRLIEPVTCNLLPFSLELDRAPFSYRGVRSFAEGSMAGSSVLRDPAGRQGAAFLKVDESEGMHSVSQVVTDGSDGEELCFSVFVRYGGCRQISLSVGSPGLLPSTRGVFVLDGDEVCRAVSDTRTGEVSVVRKRFANGWVRCSVSSRVPSGPVEVTLGFALDTEFEFAGDGCSGVFLWGPQLEKGSVPSSLLPREGLRGERQAEVVELPFEGNDVTMLLEIGVPHVQGWVPVLVFGEGFFAQIHGAKGELVVNSPSGQSKASFRSVDDDEPFLLALRRCKGNLEFYLEGDECLITVPDFETSQTLRVSGGPLHLRRSYIHAGPWPEWGKECFCSVHGLSELNQQP